MARTRGALWVAALLAWSAGPTPAQQGQPQKIFHGVGIVTAIEPTGTLTVNHQPIEGLMPAMEMAFKVNPGSLAKGVRPGDKIDFSLEGKTYTIVGLKVVGHTE
jgi:Cu/Ag efflux protein CusF